MQSLTHGAVAGALCFMIMTMTSLVAGPAGNNGRGNGSPTARAVPRASATTREEPARTTTSLHFSLEHVRVIKEYYAPRYRQLPKGLQKKYARTGQLPPGWQKKMEPLPVALEREFPRLPEGYRRGVIDGHAVVYSSRAGTIIDVAVLF